MLYVFTGTDRKKARAQMEGVIAKLAKGRQRTYLSDAHSIDDLEAAFGGGMFAQSRAVIFDSISTNEDMWARLLEQLPRLKEPGDTFFILEEKMNAANKRTLAKYAEKIETFEVSKAEKDNAIFRLRFALEKGDKKALWVGLQREFIAEKPPEAVHGFLFWAAKQIFINARSGAQKERAQKLVIALAELPHESRRRGFDLEYALERFVLSIA
jgi:hypothetical protein